MVAESALRARLKDAEALYGIVFESRNSRGLSCPNDLMRADSAVPHDPTMHGSKTGEHCMRSGEMNWRARSWL